MNSSVTVLSHKEQKEAFVTGWNGTSPWELVLLTCVSVPIGLACYQSVVTWYAQALSINQKPPTTRWQRLRFILWRVLEWLILFLTAGPVAVLGAMASYVWKQRLYRRQLVAIEAVTIWTPLLLGQTTWLYPWGVLYLLLEVMLVIIVTIRMMENRQNDLAVTAQPIRVTNNDRQAPHTLSLLLLQRTCMSLYRAALLVLTMVAILAVDFPLFPRRLVKTETTGYSLMDLGAASFVLAAGFVSRRARSTREGTPQRWPWKRLLPLLGLGLLRLLTHKGLDYQEHASEYGVHWNFFFTLTVITMAAHSNSIPVGWRIPASAMVLYQISLSLLGLQSWVEHAPRSCPTTESMCWNLWVANREGILGCVGYLSLYWMSEWIAQTCYWTIPAPDDTTNVNSATRPSRLVLAALAVTAAWSMATVVLRIPVSRRTTNLPFCLWVLALNLWLLEAIRMVVVWAAAAAPTTQEESTSLPSPLPAKTTVQGKEKISGIAAAEPAKQQQQPHLPIVLMAINRHGLLLFVLANLLTGLVNLTINTLKVSNVFAFGILLSYMGTIGAVAVAIDLITGGERKEKQMAKKVQ